MISKLNALALSEEVERDSQSRNLSRELLAPGQTLFGRNPQYPDHLERISLHALITNKPADTELVVMRKLWIHFKRQN
jgi:hypothetical protein